jgi:hypothetical protein
VLLVIFAACDAASPELGRDAAFQVRNAQWSPGSPPDSVGGPDVTSAVYLRPTLLRDGDAQRMNGALETGSTGLWIGMDGDIGGWIVPAAAPSADTPDQPSFQIEIAIAADAPLGPMDLRFLASDVNARTGTPRVVHMIAEDEAPPDGELVFALGWEGAADLDLHVVAPDGHEAWWGDPNTYEPPPPGQPFDPNAWRSGGILDRDANGSCRRDARPREHVIWTVPPPAGHYIVRVDARSMCGAASAYWFLTAYRAGELIGSAQGLMTPDVTLLPHGAGSGLTALEIDL